MKKIGAILLPIQIPPVFLLGMKGISSPICHKTEFVADFLEDPVPTTSPANVTGYPIFFKFSISSSGFSDKPFLGILYIAKACKGMSGLDQASGAGERSSVLVSPGTLKITVSILLGTSFFEVNHSASDHEVKIFKALFEDLDNSAISLNASKTKSVFESASTAVSPQISSSIKEIKGSTL